MGGTARDEGCTIINIDELQNAHVSDTKAPQLTGLQPPPLDWFALQAGAGQPSSWVLPQTVSHAGCVTLPRRISSNAAAISPVCSSCNAPLRIRSSLSDDGPGIEKHPHSGLQPMPSPRIRPNSSGGRCKSTCFRLSTALYVLMGGSFLVMALLAIAHCERRFRPRAAFENIWIPGYQTVNYRFEIEEIVEINDELPRIALGASQQFRQLTNRAEILALIMAKYGIASMIDCGCGPLTWQPDFFAIMAFGKIPFRYLGVDSSKDIIRSSKWEVKHDRVGSRSICDFQPMDLRQEMLPDGFDMLMVVDVLEKLPFPEALDILINIQSSSADFLLISNREAAMVPSGFTGLTEAPFAPPLISNDLQIALGAPLETFPDMRDRRNMKMGLALYSMAVIKSIDFQAMRSLMVPQGQAPDKMEPPAPVSPEPAPTSSLA